MKKTKLEPLCLTLKQCALTLPPLTNGPQGTSQTPKLDMALISLKNTNFKVKPNENVFYVGKELGDCLIYPHALHPLLLPVTPAT